MSLPVFSWQLWKYLWSKLYCISSFQTNLFRSWQCVYPRTYIARNSGSWSLQTGENWRWTPNVYQLFFQKLFESLLHTSGFVRQINIRFSWIFPWSKTDSKFHSSIEIQINYNYPISNKRPYLEKFDSNQNPQRLIHYFPWNTVGIILKYMMMKYK